MSAICGQLLGRGNKLQAGPKPDHRKPQTEKQTKPECVRKEGASKIISKSLDRLRTAFSFLVNRAASAGVVTQKFIT
jgi:hypothetical protein